jgi:hypothetical protein
MHTTSVEVAGKKYICHHDGSPDQDAVILINAVDLDVKVHHQGWGATHDQPYQSCQIPFPVMLTLVAEHLRSEKIAELEQMVAEEIVRLIGP